jgi:aminopeptidase N
LVDDAYPSSHPIYKNINNPYEIEEYFDEVESSKAAAIFKMVEEEKNIAEMYDAITVRFQNYLIKIIFKAYLNYFNFKQYLNAHQWGAADINVFYDKIGKIVI